MKSYINKAVAGVCSLMLLMSSCDSFLSEEPKDFLSPENLPNTEAECNMLLMGTLSYWAAQRFSSVILISSRKQPPMPLSVLPPTTLPATK